MRQTNHETVKCLVIKAKDYIVSVPLKTLGTMTAAEISRDARKRGITLAKCSFSLQLDYAMQAAKDKGLAWCQENGRVEPILFDQSSDELSRYNCHIQGILI